MNRSNVSGNPAPRATSSRSSTQTELAEALRSTGHEVVQTTVSRDIHELGLIKVRDAERPARLRAAGSRRARGSTRRSPSRSALGARDRAERQPRRRDHPARIREPRSPRRSTSRTIRDIAGTIAGENTVLLVARASRRPARSSPRSCGRSPCAEQRERRRPPLARRDPRRAPGRRARRHRILRRARHVLRARVDARARRDPVRVHRRPRPARRARHRLCPRARARCTAPRTPCSSTAATRSRARASPRCSAARSTSRPRASGTSTRRRSAAPSPARCSYSAMARARRRDLGRRLDVQGQRHRALLPLRPARERAPAHLQAVARRGVRRRSSADARR